MYGQRSLYNNNAQITTIQSGVLAQVLQLLNNAASAKSVRNLQMTGSTVDDTPIGSTTPNQARFTSLTTGLLNGNFPVIFNGPHNSQLVWNNGVLTFVNSGISTPVLNLDAGARLAWGGGANTYLEQDDQLGLVFSTSILHLGDSTPEDGDVGVVFKDQSFFGLTHASNTVANTTGQDKSFQVLALSPNDATTSNNVIRSPNNNSNNTGTAVEFDWCFPQRLRVSTEKILATSNTAVYSLDNNKQTSKVYGMRTSSVPYYSVSLGPGDDDGHVKCIQYLPQVAIGEVQAMTDPSLTSSSNTTPQLQINGRFCFPPSGIYKSSLTVRDFGVSVMLQYDTLLQAWIMLSNGGF